MQSRHLTVTQAVKFEMIINLKTAKTLAITLPPGLLSVADEAQAAQIVPRNSGNISLEGPTRSLEYAERRQRPRRGR